MNGDDLTSTLSSPLSGRTGSGNFGQNGSSAAFTSNSSRVKTSQAPASGETSFKTSEIEGDPVNGLGENTEATVADFDNEIIRPSGGNETGEGGEASAEGDFGEATVDQLAAETGEESAEADLETIPDFEKRESSGDASETSESSLQEVGTALAEQGETGETEFAFLAALVPMLISTVGPPLAKAILSRLSPQAKRRLTKVAAVATPVLGAASKAGGAIGNIATVARVILGAANKPGGEAGAEADEVIAAEAAATLEVIIGTDDRVRITTTTASPWRRYCALRITFPSGRTFRGTGSFIGPRAVATAGHCVFMQAEGGWAKSVEVIPGMNGNSKPFGSATSSNLRSVVGWVTGHRPDYDYGCVIVPSGAFGGRNLGRFNVAAPDSQTLLAKPVVLAGYPGDKPFAELWGMSRKIKSVAPRTLVYDIDTMGGQSGAPVYMKHNGERCIVGIHNYGAASGNSATRVTQSVLQRLTAWAAIA